MLLDLKEDLKCNSSQFISKWLNFFHCFPVSPSEEGVHPDG